MFLHLYPSYDHCMYDKHYFYYHYHHLSFIIATAILILMFACILTRHNLSQDRPRHHANRSCRGVFKATRGSLRRLHGAPDGAQIQDNLLGGNLNDLCSMVNGAICWTIFSWKGIKGKFCGKPWWQIFLAVKSSQRKDSLETLDSQSS